jgi:hypothetical protein
MKMMISTFKCDEQDMERGLRAGKSRNLMKKYGEILHKNTETCSIAT